MLVFGFGAQSIGICGGASLRIDDLGCISWEVGSWWYSALRSGSVV